MEDDVFCVTAGPDCKFKTYEMKKLNWLKTQLSEVVSSLQEEKEKVIIANDIAIVTELLGLVNNIQELMTKWIGTLQKMQIVCGNI